MSAKPVSSAVVESNVATSLPARCWHGYVLADAGLPPPTCVVESDELARPQYTQVRAAEFFDRPAVLAAKAERVAQMWVAATHPLVYAGAGISTAAGIRDYASRAAGSKVQPKKQALTMPFVESLKPTFSHRALAAMERRGLVWGWLQQNHDGLAQKAGFPAAKVNELHGSWLDRQANPIIVMSGSLRDDLYDWLLQMEKAADFVIAVGTSLSGLNADRLVHTASARHQKRGQGQGAVIVSIQQTPHDADAAVRVFAKIDDFMALVIDRLGIAVTDGRVHPYAAAPRPVGPPDEAAWQQERAEKRAAQKKKPTQKNASDARPAASDLPPVACAAAGTEDCLPSATNPVTANTTTATTGARAAAVTKPKSRSNSSVPGERPMTTVTKKGSTGGKPSRPPAATLPAVQGRSATVVVETRPMAASKP